MREREKEREREREREGRKERRRGRGRDHIYSNDSISIHNLCYQVKVVLQREIRSALIIFSKV